MCAHTQSTFKRAETTKKKAKCKKGEKSILVVLQTEVLQSVFFFVVCMSLVFFFLPFNFLIALENAKSASKPNKMKTIALNR